MTTERASSHPVPQPSREAHPRLMVDCRTNPRMLVNIALKRVMPPDTAVLTPGSLDNYLQYGADPVETHGINDRSWANKAAELAILIYRCLYRDTANINRSLVDVGRILAGYRHDPALLEAACSLFDANDANKQYGSFINPRLNLDGQWQERLAAYRRR